MRCDGTKGTDAEELLFMCDNVLTHRNVDPEEALTQLAYLQGNARYAFRFKVLFGWSLTGHGRIVARLLFA